MPEDKATMFQVENTLHPKELIASSIDNDELLLILVAQFVTVFVIASFALQMTEVERFVGEVSLPKILAGKSNILGAILGKLMAESMGSTRAA